MLMATPESDLVMMKRTIKSIQGKWEKFQDCDTFSTGLIGDSKHLWYLENEKGIVVVEGKLIYNLQTFPNHVQ